MTPAFFKVQRSQSQKLKGVKTETLEVTESVVHFLTKRHFSGKVEEAEKQQSPPKRPLAFSQKQRKLKWTLGSSRDFLTSTTPLNSPGEEWEEEVVT